jgi:hypothetical protein
MLLGSAIVLLVERPAQPHADSMDADDLSFRRSELLHNR